MWWIIGIFGAAWIAGWIAVMCSTDSGLSGKIALFFIWPYVAAAMNTDR